MTDAMTPAKSWIISPVISTQLLADRYAHTLVCLNCHSLVSLDPQQTATISS